MLDTLGTLDGDRATGRLTGLRVHLLDGDEIASYAWTHELGRRRD